ncbi:hypothetical protein [Actinomadura algeriensis]|uniref:Uncharacterized protein n=1 Tax=Actinomadura algeriensis TaxID=1679523 RepID=A0ABR9JQ27_9ACTN|nr:hypothetical protein [Actinomadura algeriensis]MBE1532662.1 hypothetical protein [Actinomadura algeriensis]
MLARRFGYAVSPHPAASTTPAVLDQFVRPLKFRRGLLVFVLVFLVAIPVFTGLMSGSFTGFAAACAVAPVFCLIMYFGERGRRVPSGGLTWPEAFELRKVLDAQPWQVWPCRAEQVEPHVLGATVHVFLLAPDQSVAGVLKTRLQHHTWMSMTDGYGVLWFAGDLRFGGAIADPSDPARPTVSHASAVPRGAVAASGGDSVLVEELQRQAVGWVFGQL